MKQIIRLLLITPLFLSCEREIKTNPLGPQVTPSTIDAVQRQALSKLDPYTVTKGQLVHKVETLEVISSQAPLKTLNKEWTTSVTDVENFENRREITTLKKVNDKSFDENFIYEFKNVYALAQIQNLQLLDQLNLNSHSVEGVVRTLKDKSRVEESEIEGVAFHNLRTEIVEMIPPKRVKDAKNCRGITDCKIQAEKITYDIVFLLSDKSTQIHNVEWFISSDVPFFAGLLRQCATTVIPVENARVLVRQCNEVVDFEY